MTPAMAQTPDRDQEYRHGQRVLVLWLCWVLLAVFLFAAGVVTFG
jgi:hypothetical protein